MTTTELLAPTPDNIARCGLALMAGELVAFPTETVFGLGAAVNHPDALARIFAVKNRPTEHPLIAHVAPDFDLSGWADTNCPMAQALMAAFWPGPLALVVPKGPRMPLAVTGGQLAVGLRCPAHPVAQALLKAVGVPVAAPSANRFGKISPTRASHVLQELGGRIAYVLDGEMPSVGIESTIVSILGGQPTLLRPGSIAQDAIERVLGKSLSLPLGTASDALRISGNLDKHYAPDARLLLFNAQTLTNSVLPDGTLIVGWSPAFLQQARLHASERGCTLVECKNEPGWMAQNLYCLLRQADDEQRACVVFEAPPAVASWAGVADRLKRASS